MGIPEFGLAFDPFNKQTAKEKDGFQSRDFTEMMNRLEYLKDIRGIGLFTASPGMGKTFVLKCFSERLNPNLYTMKYINLSTVTVREFYRQLCLVLGLPETGSKPALFRAVQNQIWYMFKEQRKPLILAVDEAQHLSTAILNDIKMLTNYGYDSLNCFTLILCGEPYLNSTLSRPAHEALRQRITVHYNFSGLTENEVAKYIRHKINVAGGADSIIDDAAVSAVHGFSHGNARLIDNVMSDALALATQMQKPYIDAEVAMAAINNQALV